MVAGPETEGVHWKTSSGDVPEFPQLPACVLVPLVVPPKVPPWAGISVGLLQAPPPGGVVVVVVAVGGVVVVVVALGGVAGGVEVAGAAAEAGTAVRDGCGVVSVGVG